MSWRRGVGIGAATTVGLCLFSVCPALAKSYYSPPPVKPENGRPAEVSIWEQSFGQRTKWLAMEKTYVQGGSLGSGDVDGDAKDEIIVGTGPGRNPEVMIFSADGVKKKQFKVFEPAFKGGVRVAVGDFNGDKIFEIAVAPGPGSDSMVYLYNGQGEKLNKDGVSAYAKGFTGGVHLAAADLNGDGKAELITSPGPSGGPHVRVFDGELQNLNLDFFALDQGMRDGLSIAVLKTSVGPVLAVAPESWSTPNVRLYSFRYGIQSLLEFPAYSTDTKNGVVLATFDQDNDGFDELVTALNGSAAPEVKIFDWLGGLRGRYMLHDPDYRGSLSFAALDADGDGVKELASIPASPIVVGPLDKEKFIDVSIKEQRLYAYEHGRLANTFLISSGTYKYPTPLVETWVKEKIPRKNYKWTYGTNHPDNYNLKNVKNNLRIYGPVFIHYAYWHRNFGHRMSHGCINVGLEDSDWIYKWADVGTPVRTRI